LNPANSAEIKEAPIFPQSREAIQDLKIINSILMI